MSNRLKIYIIPKNNIIIHFKISKIYRLCQKFCHVNSQIVVHKAFMGWVTMGYAKLFIMDMMGQVMIVC